jgi:hypothetical protein
MSMTTATQTKAAKMANEITVGSKVRSYDSQYPERQQVTGEFANYVEGTVTGTREIEGCTRYEILVERDLHRGVEVTGKHSRCGAAVYPPVNGTRTLFGEVLNGVEVIR